MPKKMVYFQLVLGHGSSLATDFAEAQADDVLT